ncbi:MAG: polyprenyl synthetase family protein [Pseudomonadota bacterium]
MSAIAKSLFSSPSSQPVVSFRNFGLRAVERQMRKLTQVGAVIAPVQLAVQHHLDSGGSRHRARLALASAEALSVNLDDAVAIASCAELLHNAALLHDDIHDRAAERRGRPAVWAEHGDDIAICAGDLLISAAYAALAAVSDSSAVAELVQKAHAAVATTIDGQSKDLALKNVSVSDYTVYEQVAAEKSAPLLALPLELLLTYAGFVGAVGRAREMAERLAIAYQIADDLEDIDHDSSSEGEGACLNVVNVLKNSGYNKPLHIASANAYAALRRSIQSAEQLPCGIDENLAPCFEAVFGKIQAATR